MPVFSEDEVKSFYNYVIKKRGKKANKFKVYLRDWMNIRQEEYLQKDPILTSPRIIRLVEVVCQYKGIELIEFRSKSRDNDIPKAKAYVSYIAHRKYNIPPGKVATIANVSRGMIYHYIRTLDAWLETDAATRFEFNNILTILNINETRD